ncbi:hypothetical protein SAMN05192555_101399 [Franzmannia pantelleriensis]|uniref:Uncharacterized protein n=1 Tax=Franzmannia pantelleriensis TaxID=48727 RepID=A0A1G9FG44_9GAMM|nr:hypothetical protein [Halomonas pantelleriensis]SDK87322.1 hypothetical protein SAMN05192555_101399 [Halomonas pantelleriensis]
MFQAATTANLALDSRLLGSSLATLFAPAQLIDDVQRVSGVAGPSLQRLLHVPALRERSSQRDALSKMPELALAWRRLACGEVGLTAWLPQHDGDWAAYSDFVSFVVYASTLVELHEQASLGRLQHLLGLAALRLKLDPLIHCQPELARRLGLSIGSPGYLSPVEIAAACQLRVASVRNAISRREMMADAARGVPIEAALDWMVQRRGFLYPVINAITPGRRINGRLANQWLLQDPRVEQLRRVTRLRMMQWRVLGSGRCFGVNEQGLHHCLLTLPASDPEGLAAAGLEDLEDRSGDSAVALYRQSFASVAVAEEAAAEAPIHQGVVATMQALDVLLDYLAEPTATCDDVADSSRAGPGALAAMPGRPGVKRKPAPDHDEGH